MQKILALLLSFVMSIMGLAPAVQPSDAYTQAEWYALVADQFNLTYKADDNHNYDIDANDPNYEVVQACYDWNVLVGKFEADKAVTNFIVGESLAVAAGLVDENATEQKKLDVAIDLGIVTISVSLFGKLKETTIDKATANIALGAAVTARQNKLNTVNPGGNVVANQQGQIGALSEMSVTADGLGLMSEDGNVINQDDIGYLHYEANVNPFAETEKANVTLNGQSLLEKIKGSFSVGPVKVSFAVKDDGFDVSVGGDIKGVNLTKKYEVRNFDITTKFDGDLAKKQINEAYLLMDYDVTDKTTVSGSYAASLAEKAVRDMEEGEDDLDFFARIKNGLSTVGLESGSDSVIPVFTMDVAIPNCPAITIGITAKVVIHFDGMIELVLTSSQQKGIEIINNKVRVISEEEATGSQLNALARVEATLQIGANVKLVQIVVIDVAVEVGLGVKVTATVTSGADQYTLDIPVDFLMDPTIVYPTLEGIQAVGNVKVYGIVKISVGLESPLLKVLNLHKTWTLVGESNGTFVDKDFTIYGGAAA
ncbi:MAG TPA: hypothetical protein DDY98_05190 [Ruminococcaceae bacterium]|nr:hypothetical protein [Oscillospiraceae bacterium]